MASYKIRDKLSLILNSEKIILFLKNALNGNGLGLSNAPSNVNRFLYELIESDDDIEIIDKGNRKKKN